MMTPRQIDLARHALGLDGRTRRSYRNRFVAGPGHEDYGEWLSMVSSGFAIRHSGRRLHFGGDDLFVLTKTGAEAALRPSETLDPEDFPS